MGEVASCRRFEEQVEALKGSKQCHCGWRCNQTFIIVLLICFLKSAFLSRALVERMAPVGLSLLFLEGEGEVLMSEPVSEPDKAS